MGVADVFRDNLLESFGAFVEEYRDIMKIGIVDPGSLNAYRQRFGLESISVEEGDNVGFHRAYVQTIKDLQSNPLVPKFRFSFIEGQTRAVGSAAVMTASVIDGGGQNGVEAGSFSSRYFEEYINIFTDYEFAGKEVLDILAEKRASGSFFLDQMVSIRARCSIGLKNINGDFSAAVVLEQAREHSRLHQREKHNSSQRSVANDITDMFTHLAELHKEETPDSEFINTCPEMQIPSAKPVKYDDVNKPGYLSSRIFNDFLRDPTLSKLKSVYDEFESGIRDSGGTCPSLPARLSKSNLMDNCAGCYPEKDDMWGMDLMELNGAPVFILACRIAARALNSGDDSWTDLEQDLSCRLMLAHNRTFSDTLFPPDDRWIDPKHHSYAKKLLLFALQITNVMHWALLEQNKLLFARAAFAHSEKNMFKPGLEFVLKEHSKFPFSVYLDLQTLLSRSKPFLPFIQYITARICTMIRECVNVVVGHIKRKSVQAELGEDTTNKCIHKSGLLIKLFTINHTGTFICALKRHTFHAASSTNEPRSDLQRLIMFEKLPQELKSEIRNKVLGHTTLYMNGSSSKKRDLYLEVLNRNCSSLSRVALFSCSKLSQLAHDLIFDAIDKDVNANKKKRKKKPQKEAVFGNGWSYMRKTAIEITKCNGNPRMLGYFKYNDEVIGSLQDYSMDHIFSGWSGHATFSIESIAQSLLQWINKTDEFDGVRNNIETFGKKEDLQKQPRKHQRERFLDKVQKLTWTEIVQIKDCSSDANVYSESKRAKTEPPAALLDIFKVTKKTEAAARLAEWWAKHHDIDIARRDAKILKQKKENAELKIKLEQQSKLVASVGK